MKKLISGLLLLFLVLSTPAYAQSITINTNLAPYNNLANVQGSGISADMSVRQAGFFEITGAYRTANGWNSLTKGTIVKIIYQDGSSEKIKITSNIQAGSVTATVIEGSQRDAAGGSVGSGSGGDGGSNPGGSSGGGSSGPIGGGCYGNCGGTPIIIVGDIEEV